MRAYPKPEFGLAGGKTTHCNIRHETLRKQRQDDLCILRILIIKLCLGKCFKDIESFRFVKKGDCCF